MTKGCDRPVEEWALRLLSLFFREVQLAASNLLASALADYSTLQDTIWERVGLKLEGHQKLRECSFNAVGGPVAYGQQLPDSCMRLL